MRKDILYVAVRCLVLKLKRFIKKNTQITGLTAAILNSTRKRGFTQGGFGFSCYQTRRSPGFVSEWSPYITEISGPRQKWVKASLSTLIRVFHRPLTLLSFFNAFSLPLDAPSSPFNTYPPLFNTFHQHLTPRHCPLTPPHHPLTFFHHHLTLSRWP